MQIDQLFQDGNVKIIFRENEEEAFYCFKDGDPYYLAVDMLVHQNGTLISRYVRSFEKEVNHIHYNRFVQKMLENPEYRRTYHDDSYPHWDGILSFSTEQEGIRMNQKCKEAIERLLRTKRPRFTDFSRLKTYGVDGFSRMNEEKLRDHVSQRHMNEIAGEFSTPKEALNAAKWVARGLTVPLAIRKVRTDVEISENMKR